MYSLTTREWMEKKRKRTKMKKVGVIYVVLLLAALSVNGKTEQQNSLPKVLIIGDSISIGYTPFVRSEMKGRAEIIHAPGNSQSTEYSLPKLSSWLGNTKWAVISFNWGLHDLKHINEKKIGVTPGTGRQWVPVAQYEKNLHKLVKRLKATGAQLVWCMTTPVPEGVGVRVPGDEILYNAAAHRVMRKEGVVINDLFGVVATERIKKGGKPRDVHYTKAGSALLGTEVVKYIDAALKKSVDGDAAVPELLRAQDGSVVTTVQQWESQRRGEILELFKAHVYGRNPVGRPADLKFERLSPDKEMMAGTALRKRIKASFSGPGGKYSFVFTAFIPKAKKPVPAFLLICNRDYENIDPDRVERSPFWPAEKIVSRGYAALTFKNSELDPDNYDGFTNGVHQIFQPDPSSRKLDSWGTLAAWAWGASRIMDWMETEPLIDAAHVGVLGHSRGGKTALWCGALDQRFALTISNDSGCGGAKLNRMELPKSEQIDRINKVFPHWFCGRFKEYGDNLDKLPVDQHMLVALMAPRLVYVASATGDPWAGPAGEFQSCVLASPLWKLYGLKGVEETVFPKPDSPVHKGCVGYHLRNGKHNLTEYDWKCYMDFADKHWR